jgi:hypothetical protein
VDELYSFRSIVSSGELEALIKINKYIKGSTDFENITELKVKDLCNQVQIENNAPESRFTLKKSLLKRDGGKFSSFKDSTAILSMDMILYIFDWSLLKKNHLNDAKLTINCSNLTNLEVKKDY